MNLFTKLLGPQGVNSSSPATAPTMDATKPGVPLTYVHTERREPHEGPTFLTAPDGQYWDLLPLDVPWQEAPDPIRQSQFWDAGNKIHPQAQMPITSHLDIGVRESIMEDTFQIGKLLGYIYRPMYAGGQQPSVIRANIQEAVPSTYGSQYEVQGIEPAGPFTATGFAVSPNHITPQGSQDGYPY